MQITRGKRAVELTRLDWKMWRDEGITKRDLVDYYGAVSPALLPHLRNRPFTMKRHWQGPRSPFEWVKDAPPELPEWIPVSPQPAKSRGGALVRYRLARRVEDRRGVYVDTKMNGHGQQIVSVYSVRPRPGAPVSTPLRWEEVGQKLRPERFTMREVLRRVERYGDLHEPVLRGGQRLDRALATLAR